MLFSHWCGRGKYLTEIKCKYSLFFWSKTLAQGQKCLNIGTSMCLTYQGRCISRSVVLFLWSWSVILQWRMSMAFVLHNFHNYFLWASSYKVTKHSWRSPFVYSHTAWLNQKFMAFHVVVVQLLSFCCVPDKYIRSICSYLARGSAITILTIHVFLVCIFDSTF